MTEAVCLRIHYSISFFLRNQSSRTSRSRPASLRELEAGGAQILLACPGWRR